jgi:hypothetical protein
MSSRMRTKRSLSPIALLLLRERRQAKRFRRASKSCPDHPSSTGSLRGIAAIKDILGDLPNLDPDQIPPTITTVEQLQRWRVCAGITMRVAGRLDPLFCYQLYESDLPTDDGTSEPDSSQ